MTRKLLVLITCSLSFLETGCLHPKIGPQSLPRDRTAYSSRLADSWKEQTLLNIVKLRYIDAPTFVDISSITTGYSLTQTASVGAQVNTPGHSRRRTLASLQLMNLFSMADTAPRAAAPVVTIPAR